MTEQFPRRGGALGRAVDRIAPRMTTSHCGETRAIKDNAVEPMTIASTHTPKRARQPPAPRRSAVPPPDAVFKKITKFGLLLVEA